jgi:hypothetical protein
MSYKEEQKKKQVKLIGNVIDGHSYPHFLSNGQNNLYKASRTEVLKYFKNNGISWWHSTEPTPNTLSSQISCLNHLFPICGNKKLVTKLAQAVDKSITEVLPIPCDNTPLRYIAFEVVAHSDNFLNEGKPKRGALCTSIDALIIAKRGNETCLIPIEWKYTESDKQDKSNNKTRKDRYMGLINNSEQLKNFTDKKLLFKEPYYQLMRQTLWAEQIVEKEKVLWCCVNDFIHVHVVPNGNEAMRGKDDLILNKWKNEIIKDSNKYKLIDPEELFKSLQGEECCKEHIDYLRKRYWE